MNNPYHQMVVRPDEVNATITRGLSQGWTLVSSTPQDDGQVLLQFQRSLAPARFSGMPGQAVDPNVAWLELLGLFGFLGIGYLVAGRVNDGIIRLVVFWILLGIGWTVTALLTMVLIGFCLIPVMMLISLGVPIWSALELRKELEAQYPR